MSDIDAQRVLARADRVLVEELSDELVVYDLDTDTAHLLNGSAKLVFQTASEPVTVGELKSCFPGNPDAEAIVLLAVNDLRAAGLLVTDGDSGLSRRQLLKRLGAAVVAAPVVMSIVAPSPAAAQTGGVTCASNLACPPATCCGTFSACKPTVTVVNNISTPQGNRCCVPGAQNNRVTGSECSNNNDCCSGSCPNPQGSGTRVCA